MDAKGPKKKWFVSVLIACIIGMFAVPTAIAATAHSKAEAQGSADASVVADAEGIEQAAAQLESNATLLAETTAEIEESAARFEGAADGSLTAGAEAQALLKSLAEVDTTLEGTSETLIGLDAALTEATGEATGGTAGALEGEAGARLEAAAQAAAHAQAQLEGATADLATQVEALAGLESEVSGLAEQTARLEGALESTTGLLVELDGTLEAVVEATAEVEIGIVGRILGSGDGNASLDEGDKDNSTGPAGGGDSPGPEASNGTVDTDPDRFAAECPSSVTGNANGDATVEVHWEGDANAEANKIYRAEGDGGFELLGTFDGTASQHVDTDTEAGVSYTYMVTTVVGDEETVACPQVEVTAVPVFSSVLAGAVGLTISALGYAGVRRFL